MDKKEIEKRLRNYKYIDEMIDTHTKDIKQLRELKEALGETSGIDYSGIKVQSSKLADTTADFAGQREKIANEILRLYECINMLRKQKHEVEGWLLELKCNEREIITIWLIDNGQLWKVAQDSHYSITRVKQLKESGLNSILAKTSQK